MGMWRVSLSLFPFIKQLLHQFVQIEKKKPFHSIPRHLLRSFMKGFEGTSGLTVVLSSQISLTYARLNMREFALPLDIQASLTIQKNSPCGNLQTLRKQQVPLSALLRFLNGFYSSERWQKNRKLGGTELHEKKNLKWFWELLSFHYHF